MAKLRKACAYRKLERPYTRISKFRAKSFIRATPTILITKYNMGNHSKYFTHKLELISKSDLQIRHNAFESARQSSNRVLEKELGTTEYYLQIMVYPHHILRENPVAAGAGADRFSTGMSHSFGKPHSVAAQIKKGQTIFNSINYYNNDEPISIGLKQELTPEENCEDYFKKYKRFKQGLVLTDKEIELPTVYRL